MPAKQRMLDEQIARAGEERRRKATWWLFKRLTPDSPAGLDVYAVGFLRWLFLHLGFRNTEWHLTDADVQRYGCCCGRSKFYATLDQLQRLCVLVAEPTSDGWRRYRVSEANLVECLLPADQAEYWRLLGRSAAEVALLVPSAESTSRTEPAPASPQYGQPVRNTDSQSVIRTGHYKEEEKSKAQLEKQSPPPPSCGGASASWEAVEAAAAEIAVSDGWCDWATPLRAVRNRVTPDHVLRVLQHYRAAAGAWGPGALHRRLLRCHPDTPPEAGWPVPARKSAGLVGPWIDPDVQREVQRSNIIVAGRRAGKSGEAIAAELAAAGFDADL